MFFDYNTGEYGFNISDDMETPNVKGISQH